MPDKVIDASALVALLFGEPEAERVADRIGGDALIAPSLLPFEVANACLMKIRRRPTGRDAFLAGYGLFEAMELRLLAVDQPEVLALAERTALTVYDASYLWLAQSLDADLVTLDRSLSAAFHRMRR